MKVMMLLLVSVVSLLVNPAVANPATHRPTNTSGDLNEIILAAERYNKSLTTDFFVDDVGPLFHDGCKDEFFCKVYDILHGHGHFGKRMDQEEKKIVGILRMFVKNLNCIKSPDNVSSAKRPIPDLVGYLVQCIQKRNLNGSN